MTVPHLEVVPAILAKSAQEFRKKLRAIERAVPLVQVDVMDGSFVPNATWANPATIRGWRTPTQFEVHLMVHEPERAVTAWGKLASVRRIIVHHESVRDIARLLQQVRLTGKQVGLAVNPDTPFRWIVPHVRLVDMVLVMSNDPGYSGKPFKKSTLRRVAALRHRFPKLHIGVDIGVNLTTAPLLRNAGATHIAAASSIFGTPDPIAAYHALDRAFRRA